MRMKVLSLTKKNSLVTDQQITVLFFPLSYSTGEGQKKRMPVGWSEKSDGRLKCCSTFMAYSLLVVHIKIHL